MHDDCKRQELEYFQKYNHFIILWLGRTDVDDKSSLVIRPFSPSESMHIFVFSNQQSLVVFLFAVYNYVITEMFFNAISV